MGVVSTAIARPRHVRTFVERRRLSDLLDAVDESRVTTVCAPAGYGKTTAMLYWSRELGKRGRAILWLALRAGITTLDEFCAALAAAAVKAGLDWPADASGAPINETLAMLAAQQTHRPVLIIDDAQFLPPEVTTLLSAMVASARDSMTTIIGSRNRSTVPVARLRSLGCLLEVGPADLRFSLMDAAQFVAMNGSRAVDSALLQRLVDDTKGWASGIVMAGSMHRREWSFTGDSDSRPSGLKREFEAYFDEEVLSLQSKPIRDFLVDTAVLDQLTPSACAAVTDREDSRRLLETVEEQGLFVEASDGERATYRTHPLFREMILRRLNDRDPARAARLHCRASAHFAQIGNVLRAIEHAKLSGDPVFLADQLDALAEPLTYSGFLYRVDELGSALPNSLLAGRPMLLLALAWRRIRSLAFAPAERLIDMAADAAKQAAAAEGASEMWLDHLRRVIEHRRILLMAARDDMSGIERRAEKLLAEFGDNQPYLSCALLAQLMAARRELYHFSDTLKLEAETRRALQRPGSDFASIALKSSVAPTLMTQGKIAAAEQMLEEALTLARSVQSERPGLAALPGLPLAELHYDRGDLDGARKLVDEYLPLVREWGFVDQLASGHIVHARLLVADGRTAEALAGLEEAHLVAIECGLDRLRAVTVAEQVRILIRNGQLHEAEAAFRAGDLVQDVEPFPTLNPTRQNESVAIAWLRIETHNHRLTRARKVAKRWSDFVRRTGAIRSAVTFELLLAEIAVLAGDRSEARRAAREAVALAAPAGWTRIFLDEGESIGSLLIEAYGHGPALDSVPDRFAAKLVATFHGSPAVPTEDDVGLDGKLVSRELDILTMVGGGLRNREIGDRLGLTEGTVKWYMQQIYDKLGVRRRPQAVMRARQLGVLA
jgi:LuxR family maltose regulon positive regulatory protein